MGKNPKTSAKKIEKRKSAKETKGKRVIKKITYSFFVCLFIIMIAGLGIGVGMYAAITQEVENMNFDQLAVNQSSIIYYLDDEGEPREEVILRSDSNSIWVESHEISDVMKDAIVSIEDERFYSHSGVDIKRTMAAVIDFGLSKLGFGESDFGGSSITQQMIKNITNEKDRTASRKIKEIMRAVAVEKVLSKEEILTMYLNVIPFGNNCLGVEAASKFYFDKPASELNLTEATLLAGLPQAPSAFNPLKNPEAATEKRNKVLKKMYNLKKITKEEYEEAVNSDLGLKGAHRFDSNNVYSYFADAVISDVKSDLMAQYGYTDEFAEKMVLSGGLAIHSTMDPKIQSAMEEVFENNKNFSAVPSDIQSAMTVIDPNTGEIKGIIGGRGVKEQSRSLNRATQSPRQPGSSIKPLSVYAPAIDLNKITPMTRVNDEKITIKDWSPKNSYTGYKGVMTVEKAVEISANIPAVKILKDEVGITTSYDYAKNKFKLSNIVEADKALSPLALGGLTKGATTEQMAAAYSAFANGGYYIKPCTYSKVYDNRGNVILENDYDKTRIIKSSTAYVVSDMLYNVVNGSSGTGKSARLSNVTTYGKTGTTNEGMDKWFVGYTSYYVGAVWSGRDVNEKNDRGLNTNISATLWKKVMEKVHNGYENKEIELSEGMVSTRICSVTGNLATSKCPAINQYYARGEQPKKYCSGKHNIPSPEPTENTENEIIIDDEITEIPNNSDSSSSTNTESTPDSSTSTNQGTENTPPSTSTGTGSENTTDNNGSESETTDNTPNRRPSSVVADE